MADDRRVIEEVKERTDIVTLVDGYVKLKKAGQNYSGNCPFHEEKTPSFIVSPNIQRYKCFGCGESGDVISFVQQIENIEFFDALKKLAKDAGITIETSQKKSKYAWLEDLNEFAMNFFHRELASDNGKAALKYLLDRGISKDMIRLFKIGYAGNYNSLLKAVKQRYGSKISDRQLEQSGLFTKKEKGLRDKFIDRVMFSIWSTGGKVLGFSGRQTPGNDFGPKYLNTPETPLFYKSSILLGLYHSKNHIRKEDLCILVEGNLDVISAHQFDIKNIVAPMGTAITQQQLELISRYTKNILFLFDADKAGQAAVERGFKLATKLGLNVYASSPDPYQDIDDMIQKDLSLARKKVIPKTDAFTYLMTLKKESYGDYDPTQTKISQEIVNYENFLFEDIKSNALKEQYRKRRIKITKVDKPTRKSHEKFNRTELRFLSLLLSNNLFNGLEKLNSNYFTDKLIRLALTELIDAKITDSSQIMDSKKVSENVKELVQHAILQQRAPSSTEESAISLGPRDELNQIYTKLTDTNLEKRIKIVSSDLAIAEDKGDEKEIERLSKLSVKLAQDKRSNEHHS